MIQSSPYQSIEFLKLMYPDDIWVLCGLGADGYLTTRSFEKVEGRETEALHFIQRYADSANIYFSINQPNMGTTVKPTNEDINCINYLYVEIDPTVDVNKIYIDNPSASNNQLNELTKRKWQESRDNIYTSLTTEYPSNLPKPTCIVSSGGGYQVYWKINTIFINGSKTLIEDVENRNQNLSLLFKGQMSFEISRLGRLPGTINFPTTEKLRQGRTPALAEMVFHDPKRVYSLEDFKATPKLQSNSEFDYSTDSITFDISNAQYIPDASSLDNYNIDSALKRLIIVGCDYDDKQGKNKNREQWLFTAVVRLLRKGIPAEVIYSIITNQQFEISRPVLEKRTNYQRFAISVIQNAYVFSTDEEVHKLNQEFMIVLSPKPGIYRICEEHTTENPTQTSVKRKVLYPLTEQHFKLAVANKEKKFLDSNGNPMLNDKGKPIPPVKLSKYWLEHKYRREVNSLVFKPGMSTPEGVYNLWQGFAYPAIPGKCNLYLDFVLKVICRGNEQNYNYLINWMARCVQRPAEPGMVAIVLQGLQGAGKGTFATHFGKLFGQHFLYLVNTTHIAGRFNIHLRDASFVFADEQDWTSPKDNNIINALITNPTMTLEQKHGDVVTVPNYTHWIVASNHKMPVKVEGDSRRWFILEVDDYYARNRHLNQYFIDIIYQLEHNNGAGYSALLYYLLNHDISNFKVDHLPVTESFKRQQISQLSLEKEWWLNCLNHGAIIGGNGDINIPWNSSKPIEMRRLYQYFQNYSEKNSRNKTITQTRFNTQILPYLSREGLDTKSGVRAKNVQELSKAFKPSLVFTMTQITLPSLSEARQIYKEREKLDELWNDDGASLTNTDFDDMDF